MLKKSNQIKITLKRYTSKFVFQLQEIINTSLLSLSFACVVWEQVNGSTKLPPGKARR